jgi:hypothetical protein
MAIRVRVKPTISSTTKKIGRYRRANVPRFGRKVKKQKRRRREIGETLPSL